MKDLSFWLSLGSILCFAAFCVADAAQTPSTIRVLAKVFINGGPIPPRHTCQGENLSPELSWEGIPPGTKSLALVCDDPDAPAGTWVHWVVFNLLPYETGIGEGVGLTPVLPNGAVQGSNSWKKIGYAGPCPPPGNAHRYFFRLYALDIALELKSGASFAQLMEAMKGHILGQGEVMGTYRRK